MHRKLFCLLYLMAVGSMACASDTSWIKTDFLGYLPKKDKLAVFFSNDNEPNLRFVLKNAFTDAVMFEGEGVEADTESHKFKKSVLLNFSKFNTEGSYYIVSNNTSSKKFEINKRLYQKDNDGAIIKRNTNEKVIYLIFSSDRKLHGVAHILRTLDKYNAKASFFLTVTCLKQKECDNLVRKIIDQGHYLGGHSDPHVLYATSDKEVTITSSDSLLADFQNNMAELSRFGINPQTLNFYLPPYKLHTKDMAESISTLGQLIISNTPGIPTIEDYILPGMSHYKTSEEIIKILLDFEKKNNLNGCFLVINPESERVRSDKLHIGLDKIIHALKERGYQFNKL